MLLTLLTAPPALAQETTASVPPADVIDLFGFKVTQSERFTFSGELLAGWSYDGAQATLGFENQGRIGMAILTVAGKVHDRVRFVVAVNPVSETNARPSCGEQDYFFPNDPSLFASRGPVVTCDVENGLKRVDTYNTFSLDYITQQGILREGYIDWRLAKRVSLRGGRFIVPIGLAPREVGAATAKDMTRITRLNAEAHFGAMLAVSATRGGQAFLDAGLMAVHGDGNREKDYDWYYFVNTSLDSNSAATMVASVRLTPVKAIDLRAAYKKGYSGSKVERLPSYWASKRHDDALVLSAKLSPTPWASVFGEYAKYKWGPTSTSGLQVGLPDMAPIDKQGYFVGAMVEAPVTGKIRVGGSAVREEISRDDSLIQYLSLNNLYGVSMGSTHRTTVVRGFMEISRLINVSVFRMDVSNPFPWASGSWPVSGPTAFTGRKPNRFGYLVTVKTP